MDLKENNVKKCNNKHPRCQIFIVRHHERLKKNRKRVSLI